MKLGQLLICIFDAYFLADKACFDKTKLPNFFEHLIQSFFNYVLFYTSHKCLLTYGLLLQFPRNSMSLDPDFSWGSYREQIQCWVKGNN